MPVVISIGDRYEILDEDGRRTGATLERSEVHSKALWHGVVNVWIVNSKGEILMQLRAPGVELSPNVWDVTVGTHLRVGEAPADAALRCLHTELGLSFMPEDLKHLFNIKCANPMPNGITHNVFGHVFLINRDVTIGELTFDPQKIARLSWMPLMQVMAGVGSTDTRSNYFPRSNNYYPQLFEALQGLM
jgi:isopentenyldiphosphate isomerase